MYISLATMFMNLFRLSYDVRKPRMNLGIARIHMS
ncbi:hypothetical protein F383_00765 [Gossypium arboreum]|uniref:Uncharacterized protein n=1 Tax=Gossypium arboreum TaxID=29729 RepID=A0A0B0PG46_GOSAR|nr:hypothetical protein F383_00765 [Gossypium arboreum]